MRRTAIKRKTPLRTKYRPRIASRSPAKAADDAKYRVAKAAHLREHPQCQYPLGCARSLLRGDKMDLHHKGGRRGPLLYCRKYFATACRQHHDLAKERMSESRRIGWVIDVSSEEVQRLKLDEVLNSS